MADTMERADVPNPTCSVRSCERPERTRGWCHAHYERWRTTGDVQADRALPQRKTKRCSIAGCVTPVMGRGWCQKHYNRWYRHGDPEAEQTDAERFWEKVDRGSRWDCWQWQGDERRGGYGVFYCDGGFVMAHRWAYEQFIGPIPGGLDVDHVCHNLSDCFEGFGCPHRRCVNPWHLEAVTTAENNRRAGRRKTHCVNGHEFTDENTRVYRDARHCRTCDRERRRVERAGK